MSKKAFITLSLVIVIISIISLCMYLVDLNLVLEGKSPKFCINKTEHRDSKATKYTSFVYSIIKYESNRDDVKFKVRSGNIFLKFDDTLIDSLNGIGISGEIKSFNLNKNGSYNMYIESSYNKANITFTSNCKIYKGETELKIKDLKVGQNVDVICNNGVMESYPLQGVADTIYILD